VVEGLCAFSGDARARALKLLIFTHESGRIVKVRVHWGLTRGAIAGHFRESSSGPLFGFGEVPVTFVVLRHEPEMLNAASVVISVNWQSGDVHDALLDRDALVQLPKCTPFLRISRRAGTDKGSVSRLYELLSFEQQIAAEVSR